MFFVHEGLKIRIKLNIHDDSINSYFSDIFKPFISYSESIYKDEINLFKVDSGYKLSLTNKIFENKADISNFICRYLFHPENFSNAEFLHGGAVCKNGNTFAFLGNTGAGKSTLISELVNNNYSYLTDDVIPILGDGMIYSYPKPILLRDINHLKFDITKSTQIKYVAYTSYNNSNRHIVIPNNVISTKCKVEIKDIFVLNRDNFNTDLELKKLEGESAFCSLYNNFRTTGLKDNFMSTIKLIKSLNIYEVRYSDVKQINNLLNSFS